MTDKPLVKVEVSPTFKRNIKTLGKKYRSIRQDVEPVIKQLQKGELPGNKITGIGYSVFKLNFCKDVCLLRAFLAIKWTQSYI